MTAGEHAYQSGFGNHFATEALPGALPQGQNSPQRCPYGLYAEQLSGSAFTAPRAKCLRSWLYRIRPSVLQSEYQRHPPGHVETAPLGAACTDPNPMRWDPIPDQPVDFVSGLVTIAASGDAMARRGMAVHLYACGRSMDRCLYDADGDLLIVPQEGGLELYTELGVLALAPGEIAVVPRGIRFQVRLAGETARGYCCENYGAPFELPELGPIGANGLANPRDFQAPTAHYEDERGDHLVIAKLGGRLWRVWLDHSPLDVVAWHGNYTPYKYDLARFNAVNTVSFDHADPSIFTMLTAPSEVPGTANCDFVVFPPRWLVAEHSFRPPYFHRNVMSEYMGLIRGTYDAKAEGFVPGGGSLHGCMTPHGPDAATYERAAAATLAPEYLADTLAFMFESRLLLQPTEQASKAAYRQRDYGRVWQGLASHFDPERP